MATEPQLRRGSAPSNTYVNRWRWWYAAISDEMLANPGATLEQIAKKLNRGANTISMIVNTDLFRDYHAQRRKEFQETHDFSITSKLGKVAEQGLDLLLEVMQSKRDKVPLGQLVQITNTALENLGYGAPAAGTNVSVNVQQNANPQVVAPVSAAELGEARDALRRAEAKRLEAPAMPMLQQPTVEVDALLAEEDPDDSAANQ